MAGEIPETIEDIESAFHDSFPEERQTHTLTGPEVGKQGDPQVNTLLTWLDPRSLNLKKVLDYGAGRGALIPPFLEGYQTIREYICVNHTYEDGQDLNEEIKQYVENTEAVQTWKDDEKSGKRKFSYHSVESFEQQTKKTKVDMVMLIDVLHEIPLVELPLRLYHIFDSISSTGKVAICALGKADRYELDGVFWNDKKDFETVFPDTHFHLERWDQKTRRGSQLITVLISKRRNKKITPELFEETCSQMYRAKAKRLYLQMRKISSAIQKLSPPEEEETLKLKEQELQNLQIQFNAINRQKQHLGYQDSNKLKVGNSGYIIRFREVTIDSVKTSHQKLTKMLDKNMSLLYGCLGQYDLMSIEKFDDLEAFQEAIINMNPLVENVVNTNTAICFEWEGHEVDLKNLNAPFMGICFLKIQDTLLEKKGVSLEFDLIDHLTNPDKQGSIIPEGVKVDVLGGLGWNEITLIISTEDPAKIFEVAAKIRDHAFQEDFKHPSFLSSFTIVGYNISDLNQVDKILSDSSFEVNFTAKPGYKAEIEKWIREEFPGTQAYGILGKSDFLCFDLKMKNPISSIIEYRKKLKNKLASTSTSLLVKTPARYLNGDITPLQNASREGQPQEFIKELGLQRIKKLLKKYPSVSLSLQQMLAKYYTCVYDPFVIYEVMDIKYCIEEEMRAFLKVMDDSDDLNRDVGMLSSSIHSVYHGLQQRYQGTSSTIYNLNEITSIGTTAGIQRVIKAANVVPMKLLNQLHNDWNGFTIFGALDLAFRGKFGIMNLPIEELLSPYKWVWYSHEIGHEHLQESFDYFIESLENATESGENAESDENTKPKRHPFTYTEQQLVNDIIADIFMLIYGCNKEWDQFLKTQWSQKYKVRFQDPIQRKRHLWRLFGTWFFLNKQDAIQELKSATSEDIGMQMMMYYNEFHSNLTEHNYKPLDLISGKLKANTENIEFLKMIPGICEMYSFLENEMGRKRLLSFTSRKSEIDLAVKHISKGGILTAPINNPEQLIWELNKKGRKSIRANIALLISLYNTYYLSNYDKDE